ncbi:MAG: serine hydrolase, partial [Acidobacteriota bacterium]
MKLTRRQCLLTLGAAAAATAAPDLLNEWRKIASATDGIVAAAALHLRTGHRLSLNGDQRCPLASVCKLPMAMNMFALVDEGKFTLQQPIEVLLRDVNTGVSPLSERWPAQRSFPLDEMLELMVARSDNTVVETFFRIGGEGPAMAARFRQWKVSGMRIDRSERQCGLDRAGVEHYPPASQWTNDLVDTLYAKVTPAMRARGMQRFLKDPRDTGTPNGTVDLLAKAFRGQLLSKPSTARLIEILKATTTFPTRLKGLLPPGTVVAHKTGSTGTVNGFTAATNDSGVIFLPDGNQLAV